MKDEISEIIDDEEKLEKLNKLIENKVEEKIEKKLKMKEEEKAEKEEVSRRGFMKKIGAGALGLGALSISPVSAYDIKSSHGLEVWDSGTEYFEVINGNVNLLNNASLDVGDSRITSVSDPNNAQDAATKSWVEDNLGGDPTLLQVLSSGNDISGNDIVDNGTTVWDSNSNYIPAAQLDAAGLAGNQLSNNSGSLAVKEGSGSGLNADTLQGNKPSDLQASQTQKASGGGGWVEIGSYTDTLDENQSSSTTLDAGWSSPKMVSRIKIDCNGGSNGYESYSANFNEAWGGSSGWSNVNSGQYAKYLSGKLATGTVDVGLSNKGYVNPQTYEIIASVYVSPVNPHSHSI